MPEPTQHLSDERLYEFLDAALGPAQGGAVEGHLAECPECAGRLARLRALFVELDALPDLPLARDLAPSILVRLQPASNGLTNVTALRWAVAIQLIVAAALIVAVWPSLTELTRALVSPSLMTQSLTMFAGLRGALAELWASGLVTLNAHIAQSLDRLQNLPSLPLAQIAWLPLIGAASLLWLVGNGLLVLPTIVRPRAQHHHRK
jgi:anti-sigma factor RsiW